MARETIIDEAVRNAGTVTSPSRASTLKAVRLVDGKPQFGEADTCVRLIVNVPTDEARNRLDSSLEWSADGATNWRTVVGMSGITGGALGRDGLPSVPSCSWSSTAAVASGFFRVIATTNRRYTYSVELEVA